jgi:hypothetical protein
MVWEFAVRSGQKTMTHFRGQLAMTPRLNTLLHYRVMLPVSMMDGEANNDGTRLGQATTGLYSHQ